MLFEGCLICSDWDNTINYNKNVLQKDIDAIEYFQANGGLFTICSGRSYDYIKANIKEFKANTYLITLNGAIIVDPENGTKLYEGFLPKTAYEAIECALSIKDAFYKMNIYYEGRTNSADFSVEDYTEFAKANMDKQLYKVVLIGSDETAVKAARDLLNAKGYNGLLFVRSWPTGLEIIAENQAKGSGTKRVKEAVGAKLLINVGDYENDIQMLEQADIGYAVGNATEELKAVADKITVPASMGAIAQIIKDLETKLKSSALF